MSSPKVKNVDLFLASSEGMSENISLKMGAKFAASLNMGEYLY